MHEVNEPRRTFVERSSEPMEWPRKPQEICLERSTEARKLMSEDVEITLKDMTGGFK